ncbi:DUF7511 domain-containing protein [Halocalculus aciditolerans]|uniref:DUF7511 domain-containing protein n=1 Tax=Halocalculus aciditolerans TaxID=1383812 RepID=A0A830EZW3_9EURY|nr:hypothetical protein [Halocalculus aciditolerans]GGL48826.1 hypothetical protein GCM10009039_03790 [Halocalculus aciditolerans]
MSRIERPPLDASRRRDPARGDHDALELDARIERYDDEELCTIHPADADDDTLVTTWLSARDDAFVDLDEMR